MSAISLINPYAPQPSAGALPESGVGAAQTAVAIAPSKAGQDASSTSDHSGQGAGNGTGTGGAHLTALLERGRKTMQIQQPTSKSIIEAQSESGPTGDYLAKVAQQRESAKAADDARAADQAAAQAERSKAEAKEAAEAKYEMPNPLPTAPILQRDDP